MNRLTVTLVIVELLLVQGCHLTFPSPDFYQDDDAGSADGGPADSGFDARVPLDDAGQDAGNTSLDAGPLLDASPDGGIPCDDIQIIQVSAGRDHTCALRACGMVSCWGEGNSGQLGDGRRMRSLIPVTVSTLVDAVEVRVGNRFSCALRRTGSVVCWGANGFGELGDGSTSPRNTPTPVLDISNAIRISTGLGAHTCVIHEGRSSVSCWGLNERGQLGDNTTEPRRRPVPTTGLGAPQWERVATGNGHTCAHASDQTLLCWGNNGFGSLGDSTQNHSSSPVAPMGITNVTFIAAGGGHTIAGSGDSGIHAWGGNRFGQLGVPVSTSMRVVPAFSFTTAGLAGVVAGLDHTCAFNLPGNVVCTGRNDRGQLGIGTTDNSDSPQALMTITGVRSMSAGEHHTCAIVDDNSVRCWGSNDAGQLGDGSTINRTEPVSAMLAR